MYRTELNFDLLSSGKKFRAAGLPVKDLNILRFANEDRVSFKFESGEILVFTDWDTFSLERESNKLHSWLFLENDPTPVCYAGIHIGRNPTGELMNVRETVIGNVEVRKDRRGAGLAFHTISLIQDFSGHKVHSSGHYSPEGFRSLVGKFPYTQDTLEREFDNKRLRRNYDEIGVWFPSMSFVKDWNTLTRCGEPNYS